MANKRTAAMALIWAGLMALVTSIRADEPAAPAEPPPPPPPVLRVYDVHDLLEPDWDYHIYDIARTTGFASGLHTEPYVPMGTPSPSPAEEQGTMRTQRVEDLLKSLEGSVAPDSWRDNGGSEGAVRESQGMLIVTQPLANQKLVKEFLDQMSERMSKMVRVEADWVWDSPENTVKLLSKNDGANSSAGAIQQVDAARLASLPTGARRHVHAEITGRNGQTMFVVSGREKSLVTNVTPIVSTATSSFAPTVSTVAGGAALQVKATAKPDQGYAVLVLAGGYDELGPTRRASAAAVAGTALDFAAATQPSATSQPTAPRQLPPDALPSTRSAAGAIRSRFQTTSMTIQELRTTLRVPLGRPVIAARATWNPTAKDHAGELLLIVTVHADK